jgi:hypothetical protein
MSDFFDGIDNAMDKQREADSEAADAPKYDPKAGDELHGVLLKAEAFTKGQWGPTILISFRNVGDKAVGGVDAGESGVLFTPTVLRRKLLEAQPAIGTPFALRFEGSVTPEGGGNAYKDWTLLTSYQKTGDSSEVDPQLWNSIATKIDGVQPAARRDAALPEDGAWKF